MHYLLSPSHGRFSDLGSTFECDLIPLASPDQLKEMQEEFKKAYPKADHYPYAFRYEGLSRSSDDGEPSGTGGRALLSLLEQKECDCCLIIVARYFGGTKLGIPRLRRAFIAAGENAIENAKLYVKTPLFVYELTLSYSDYSLLQNNQARYGFTLKDTIFDVNVLTSCCSASIMDTFWEKMGLNPSTLPTPKQEIQFVEVKK